MTTRQGQERWIERLFGKLTERQKRAARRYHERVLHGTSRTPGIGRVIEEIGRREAEEELGEPMVRRMTREHDSHHDLS